ncbi:GNAT family N-acetyltransferase [Halovulum sp. GXIMD14793]
MTIWFLLIGGAGLLIARALDAPRALMIGIGIGTLGMVAMIWIAQPTARPGIAEFQGFVQLAFVVAVIAGYRLLFRQIARRKRTAKAQGGFELLENDTALARRLEARIAAEIAPQAAQSGRDTFAIASYGPDRKIMAGGQVQHGLGLAEIRALWVAQTHRRQGLGRELLTRLETEAKARGAGTMMLSCPDPQANPFCTELGYRPLATLPCAAGPTRTIYTKDLE